MINARHMRPGAMPTHHPSENPRLISPAQTAIRGISVGLQSALRELGVQAASQGTQALVRALIVSQAHRPSTARWVSPGVAGAVVVVAGVTLGARAVDIMARGRVVPNTGLARGLLTSLPAAIEIAGVATATLQRGSRCGIQLLAGMAARMTGCIAGGLVSQLQNKAWGTLRLVTPEGGHLPATRIAHDIDPLRMAITVALYALECLCFLVLLAPHLAAQEDATPDSVDFGSLLQASRARALSAGTMEAVHAFVEALVQVSVVLSAGLAFEYVPGGARRVLDNVLDWRATWHRVCDYAGVRVWLGSLASDLPAALTAVFAGDATARASAQLTGARTQVLMALRGWILQQPGEVAAQQAQAQRETPEAAVIRIRVMPLHAREQPEFDVTYGRLDDCLDFEPARGAAPG